MRWSCGALGGMSGVVSSIGRWRRCLSTLLRTSPVCHFLAFT
jgi:hypothetical protein